MTELVASGWPVGVTLDRQGGLSACRISGIRRRVDLAMPKGPKSRDETQRGVRDWCISKTRCDCFGIPDVA
ncbi:MAG: hypothetical protein F4103_00155 [Boseongicola sp. SB0673_bin_14]|nr:hypothetical protein [Boseongicola sp. SB0667_bin_21]MYI67231.1 hypothetical protein [Boseongicola sp. SB0673_bin_14]